MIDRMLVIAQVAALSGVSKNTIYRLIKLGKFPDSVQISYRRVCWRQSDIQEWIRLGPDQWSMKYSVTEGMGAG